MLLGARGPIGKLKRDTERGEETLGRARERKMEYEAKAERKGMLSLRQKPTLVPLCRTNPLTQPPNPASEVPVHHRRLWRRCFKKIASEH